MSLKNEVATSSAGTSVILTPEVRARINAAIVQLGEATVVRTMMVNGGTLARGAAGWPLRRGSALQIQAGLEAL